MISGLKYSTPIFFDCNTPCENTIDLEKTFTMTRQLEVDSGAQPCAANDLVPSCRYFFFVPILILILVLANCGADEADEVFLH